MHVLVTADTIGGVWTYTRELVTGLLGRGVRVTLVSFGNLPKPAQTQWLERLPNLDFRPTGFPLEWMQDAAPDIAASTEFLQRVIDDVKPELLHLNQYCYGTIPCSVPRVVVAHSDVVSWWVAVHGCEPEPSEWIRWYRQLVEKGLAAATAVVAPSAVMLENARRYFGVRGGQVIHNGRSPHLFDRGSAKQNAALAVGRIWDEAKNVATLLEARPELPVWIAGSAASPGSGGNVRFRSLHNVSFKGELSEPELRALYARAAIYVATPQYEPFGLALVEAALSGCAIVANEIATFHELWDDTVFYYAHNDPAALRKSLNTMNDDGVLRREYADRAYRRATTMFSADQMVDRYLRLYGELVQGRSSEIRAAVPAAKAEAVS